jgi:hypothetical protein
VSKSDFATYTFAVRALESLGARLAGGVELHFTYDEEFGGELGPGDCSRKASSGPTCSSPPASATRSSPRTTAACSSR